MTKEQLQADIESRRLADINDLKLAIAECKLHHRYRVLLKLNRQGRSVENIAQLTGMTPIETAVQLIEAGNWWLEASKHTAANLDAAINPPERN